MKILSDFKFALFIELEMARERVLLKFFATSGLSIPSILGLRELLLRGNPNINNVNKNFIKLLTLVRF